MCMAVFIGARSPLPLIPDKTSFNVTALDAYEELVRHHFAVPHICHAGSHTGCGCGFNEGREHPGLAADPVAERASSMASSARLAQYVREHRVGQIYSCWSGDEGRPQEFNRRIRVEDLTRENFFFRERELLDIDYDEAIS